MPTLPSKKFWWVNQNQTFDHEYRGGYLWSPKKRSDGGRNQFYENMRMVAPGDIVFSFKDTFIAAVGVAKSYGYECPKPSEFGTTGTNWERVGWRVDVDYQIPQNAIRPKQHMHILASLLPGKYAPLRSNGDGLQGVYLAEITSEFATALATLIGPEIQHLLATQADASIARSTGARGNDEWEEHLQKEIKESRAIAETEKSALIKARRGQGIFKENVLSVESSCRITKVDNPIHLIGSHIKPWRDSSNSERLDGENGLLLTPSIDHLFDRGFISFEGNGQLLISPRADKVSLRRMGVAVAESLNVGSFSQQQRSYLEFHRDAIFLKARQA